MLRRGLAGVLPALALALTTACGGGGGGGGIAVKLAEWSVAPEETSAPAGEVTFDISNEGANVHEFVIFKTDLAPEDLPLKPEEDSTVVDEEGEGLALVDEVEDIAPGSSATLTVDLEPGNYILLCNIPGHFEQGMHAAFTVS